MDNAIELYFIEEAKNRDLEWLIPVLKDTNMSFSEIGKYYDDSFMDVFRKYIPTDRLNLLLKVEIFFKSIHNKFQQNDSATSSMSISIGESADSNLIITYSNLNREMQEILHNSVGHRNNSNNDGGVDDNGEHGDEEEDEDEEREWLCPANTLLESSTEINDLDQSLMSQNEDSRDLFENAMKRYPPQSLVNLLPDHNRFGQIKQFNCAQYTLPDIDQLAEEIKIANNAKKRNAIYQKVVDKLFRQMISEYFVYSMPEHIASFVCMLVCNHYPEFAINDDHRPERHLHEKLKNKFSNYRSSIGKKTTTELKNHIDSTIKKRKPPITSIVNSKSKRNQLKQHSQSVPQQLGQQQQQLNQSQPQSIPLAPPTLNNNNNNQFNSLSQQQQPDNNIIHNNNNNNNSDNNNLNSFLKTP